MQIEEVRLARAMFSLEGLSVGDAFGEKFFIHPDLAETFITLRSTPSPPWYFTDDTQMALSIVSTLRRYREINQDELAKSFAERYEQNRGYGAAMHGLLADIRDGKPWHESASTLYAGQGSYGNGAAMRVAPLGAYFADDLDLLVEEARKSAEVTHTHPEAIAGAIAVAVAAGFASNLYRSSLPTRQEFLDQILAYIPEGEVYSKVRRARDIAQTTPTLAAGAILGNGTQMSAADTVPFALWCAAQYLNDYTEALWESVSVLGDRDTTCAIVGSIVVLCAGIESIPSQWLQLREPLPEWGLEDLGF